METVTNKMTIEIWSDIMCPFCYLGKRKFENALNQFSDKDKVNIIWKSFQLNPDLKTDTTITVNEYLSVVKGIEPTRAQEMNDYVTRAAGMAGLEYNLDKAVVANTFRAHILLHFAKKQGKQNEVKERLLMAYFTEGTNIDDVNVLMGIGERSGLNTAGLPAVFETEEYSDAVRKDIYEAQQLGIGGVPFFVFDRTFAVSGAQEIPVFSSTLEKAFAGWLKKNHDIQLQIIQGENCAIDGDCSDDN
jgi:predicted DsbA family dithiol-disulfide isomerase